MPSKSLPYERFGSYILFSKIESDPLSELWRAGKIVGESITDHFAVRRFTGGDSRALRRSAEHAGRIAQALSGTAVVKQQEIDSVDGTTYVAWEFAGGRPLSHILHAAVGSSSHPANPIPVDQALAIAEKVAFSVETTANLKQDGRRLFHGAVIPHLVWISEDGDIRTGGQQMYEGIVTSLRHPAVAPEIAGYFAPEIRQNGEPTQSSEVFSLGAILYALVTGNAPPDALTASAFHTTIQAATLMVTHDPVPAEIRHILEKAMAVDPAGRYSRPGAVREALSALTHGDSYAPTTFNLAFYIHNLLREEMEVEAKQRDLELGVDLAPYLAPEEPETPPEPRVAAVPASMMAAEAAQAEESKGGGKGLIIGIILALVIAGSAAGWWFTVGKNRGADSATPSETVAGGNTPTSPPVVAEPLVTSLDTGAEPSEIVEEGEGTEGGGSPAALDPAEAERERLIEEEINRRLQEEMMKLQAEYDKKLRQAQTKETESKPTPAPAEVQKAVSEPEPAPAKPVATPKPAPTETSQGQAPAATPVEPQKPAATPAPPPQEPAVKEGDLVEIAQVDSPPRLLESTPPEYPPLAARQRAEATIILSALIDENGRVIDVRVLRGDSRRLGLDEAAISAVRKSIYSPAVKSGKKVRTWMPVPVMFQASRRR